MPQSPCPGCSCGGGASFRGGVPHRGPVSTGTPVCRRPSLKLSADRSLVVSRCTVRLDSARHSSRRCLPYPLWHVDALGTTLWAPLSRRVEHAEPSATTLAPLAGPALAALWRLEQPRQDPAAVCHRGGLLEPSPTLPRLVRALNQPLRQRVRAGRSAPAAPRGLAERETPRTLARRDSAGMLASPPIRLATRGLGAWAQPRAALVSSAAQAPSVLPARALGERVDTEALRQRQAQPARWGLPEAAGQRPSARRSRRPSEAGASTPA